MLDKHQREADIKTLENLLSNFNHEIFESFIKQLKCNSIKCDTLSKYLTTEKRFNSIALNDSFELYDTALCELIKNFAQEYAETTNYGKFFFDANPNSKLPATFVLDFRKGKNEIWEEEKQKLLLLQDSILVSYEKWTNYVKTRYPEISKAVTNDISKRVANL